MSDQDESGQMPDAIERKLNDLDHIEISAKAIELLARNHAGEYNDLFEYIAHGHGETFLYFLAYMSSYRIANQEMSQKDFDSAKLGCLNICQKLEEELRPMLEPLVNQIANNTRER